MRSSCFFTVCLDHSKPIPSLIPSITWNGVSARHSMSPEWKKAENPLTCGTPPPNSSARVSPVIHSSGVVCIQSSAACSQRSAACSQRSVLPACAPSVAACDVRAIELSEVASPLHDARLLAGVVSALSFFDIFEVLHTHHLNFHTQQELIVPRR